MPTKNTSWKSQLCLACADPFTGCFIKYVKCNKRAFVLFYFYRLRGKAHVDPFFLFFFSFSFLFFLFFLLTHTVLLSFF